MSLSPHASRPHAASFRLCLLALLGLVAACQSPSSMLPDDAIVVGTVPDIQTINELISATSGFNNEIINQLFVGLLEEQPDYAEHPPTFKPHLAESYEFSPDRLQLTFNLRRNAVWSDGEPITAEDVRWTWVAQTHPEVAWDWSHGKSPIAEVEIIDPHTVRFHFKDVSPAQLQIANEGVILPKHAWGKLPFSEWRTNANWFVENLVTSGPFILEDWDREQKLVLKRNDRYYETGLPRVERVIFRVIPDQTKLTAELLAGRLDFIRNVEAADASRIESSERTRLLRFPGRQYTFVCWNTTRPQLSSVEVRRALAMAVDRETLVELIWQGHARVATSPIISTVWAHNDAIEPWPYDPERAGETLEQDGWVDADGDGVRERGGVRLSFELVTNPGNRARWDAAILIQQQLREVGVEVKPRLMELDTLIGKALRQEIDSIVASFAMDTSLDLGYSFHSRSIASGSNWAAYRNDEVDDLIDSLARETEPEAMKVGLDRIQVILHEDQPLLFLWEPERIVGLSSRIENVRPNPVREFASLREWSLKSP